MTDQPTDDRTWALVTGASKGIGAATAVALARQGRNVLVGFGGDADGAATVVAACEDAGVVARAVRADLSTSVEPLAEAAEDVGGVAVLVNNAGITADGLVFGMDDDAFARVLDVNLTASFRLSRAVLRRMLRARFGRIVNVTSVVDPDSTERIDAVSGQLFFASTNDLVHQFDYDAVEVDRVEIDLSEARVWDTSGVVALDTVVSKFAQRGITAELVGLNRHAEALHASTSPKLKAGAGAH